MALIDNLVITVPANAGVQEIYTAPLDTHVALNLSSGFVWVGKKEITQEDGFPLFAGSIYYEFDIPKGETLYVLGPIGDGYNDALLKVLVIPIPPL